MKLRFVHLLIALALPLCACSTQTANLDTTAGSGVATVDNAGTIGAGAAVTSANTPSNETVATITGTAVNLALPASATGTVSATFKNTVAVQFANDEKAYEQTVGTALQTILPLIAQGETAASALNTVAVQWGLEPSNPTQRTAFTNIQSDLTKASASATLLQAFVTGLQTSGAVAAPASGSTTFYLQYDPTMIALELNLRDGDAEAVTARAALPLRLSASLRPVYGWKDAYNVALAR